MVSPMGLSYELLSNRTPSNAEVPLDSQSSSVTPWHMDAVMNRPEAFLNVSPRNVTSSVWSMVTIAPDPGMKYDPAGS